MWHTLIQHLQKYLLHKEHTEETQIVRDSRKKIQVDEPMLELLTKMSFIDFPQSMPGLVMLNTKVNLEIVHC